MTLLDFFFARHAAVHAGDVYGTGSPADRVLGGLTDDQMRARPVKGVNSLVWLVWHMARTEDVAVNLVVAARPQVLDDAWIERMNVPWRDIGTGMTDDDVAELTARADVTAVRAYRSAVGARTRDVAATLPPAAGDDLGGAGTARGAAAGAFSAALRARAAGGGVNPWQGPRGARLGGAGINHNAGHLGEAVTIRGLAGVPVGI